MRRGSLLAACLLAWPASAADRAATPPDPEFLEFLAENAVPEEDERFIEYLESRKGERELKRVLKVASKDDDDE
jgi:hypothetical protein